MTIDRSLNNPKANIRRLSRLKISQKFCEDSLPDAKTHALGGILARSDPYPIPILRPLVARVTAVTVDPAHIRQTGHCGVECLRGVLCGTSTIGWKQLSLWTSISGAWAILMGYGLVRLVQYAI